MKRIPYLSFAAALVAFAFPALAEPPVQTRPKMAVTGMSAVSPDVQGVEVLTEVMVTAATGVGRYDVIGASDIAALLGMERQRKLLGCSDESASCLAELSGALGAELLLVGAVGKVGEVYRVDIRLIDANKAMLLGRVGENVQGDQGELVLATQRLVKALLAPEDAGRARLGLILGGSGAALLAAGGAVGYLALNSYRTEVRASEAGDLALYDESRAAANRQILVSNLLYGAGAAALGVGAYYFFTEGSAPEPRMRTSVAGVVVTPQGGHAFLRGSF